MGRIRDRDFQAVIGVGGIGQEPVRQGIARKITWIGIGPHQVDIADDGYPMLAFEKFYLKNEKGRLLSDYAPKLAKRHYVGYGVRSLMLDSSDPEVAAILKLARRAPPSPALLGQKKRQKRCKKRTTC